MGNWGTNIEDSDIYLDVEAEFLELLSEGISKKKLLQLRKVFHFKKVFY